MNGLLLARENIIGFEFFHRVSSVVLHVVAPATLERILGSLTSSSEIPLSSSTISMRVLCAVRYSNGYGCYPLWKSTTSCCRAGHVHQACERRHADLQRCQNDTWSCTRVAQLLFTDIQGPRHENFKIVLSKNQLVEVKSSSVDASAVKIEQHRAARWHPSGQAPLEST